MPNLKVLIIEDEFMIADMAEEAILANGFEVCGIARTVSEALALGQLHRPDLALVDCRLAEGGSGTDAAAGLRRMGKLGILYATGNNTQLDLLRIDGDACIGKPYRLEDLIRALRIVAELVATGTASPPFPHGFQLLNPQSVSLTEFAHG